MEELRYYASTEELSVVLCYYWGSTLVLGYLRYTLVDQTCDSTLSPTACSLLTLKLVSAGMTLIIQRGRTG